MSAEHLANIAAQGWTRVDTAPGEWVALVLNIEATGFGLTRGRSSTEALISLNRTSTDQGDSRASLRMRGLRRKASAVNSSSAP